MMRRLQPHLLAVVALAFGCKEEEQPLLPGLPVSVQSVTFEKSIYTNSGTMIANGVNAIEFELKFLDAAGKPVKVADSPLEVWVNGTTKLPPPYRFTTEEDRVHRFSLRTLEGEIFKEDAGSVSAIPVPMLDFYRVPVIFHYFEIKAPYLLPAEQQNLALAFLDSLASVNAAFANRRGSKDPNAIDARIEFYAATTNPDGKPLLYEGVEFAYAPGLTGHPQIIEQTVSEYFWPPWDYLNIWVIPVLDGVNGFATYPEFEATETGYPTAYYGVYVRPGAVRATILSHELGHALNLMHTFGTSDCFDSDRCKDTQSYDRGPNPDKVIFGMRSGCRGAKFAGTNYMDYSMTNYTTFTREQVLRMHGTLINSPYVPGHKKAWPGRKRTPPPVLRGSLTRDNGKLVID